VVVVDVDRRRSLRIGALDEAPHRRQRRADVLDEDLGVLVVVLVEHVDDDQRALHDGVQYPLRPDHARVGLALLEPSVSSAMRNP